jgi:predicted metalloprotease with PDZ domain
MQRIFEQVAGVPMGDRFDAWVRGTAEIRYDATLAHVGLTFDRRARPDAPPCSLGVRLRIDAGRAFVGSVTRGSAAGRGGIDAGDEILAVAGARIEGGHLDAALRRCAPGQAVEVVVARAGALAIKNVELDPPVRDRGRLAALRDASNEAKRAFETWLGAPHSSLASLSEGAS